MSVNLNATPEDTITIHKIGKRFSKIMRDLVKKGVLKKSDCPSQIDIEMDVTACHLNGNLLDLKRLLGADDFNFSHDLVGINKHLDRKTGKLKDCFVPRCSKRP
jgi:hypothetical protein